ncbi:MAG: hypothetical protein BroJett013_30240 [Alphaproteobacteria bacterium]|nr:MAG: hypothetical protein BroJett013_30240 [Alphaproteobacteria bacterium]
MTMMHPDSARATSMVTRWLFERLPVVGRSLRCSSANVLAVIVGAAARIMRDNPHPDKAAELFEACALYLSARTATEVKHASDAVERTSRNYAILSIPDNAAGPETLS